MGGNKKNKRKNQKQTAQSVNPGSVSGNKLEFNTKIGTSMQGVLGLNMHARDVINKYLEQYKEQLILRIKAQPPDAPSVLNPKAIQDV